MFGLGPCLAEGVLCFELCEQRLTPPMSNSLLGLAGIKRCIFSVFLLGFRTFYPLHVLAPHKIIPGTLSDLSLIEIKHAFLDPRGVCFSRAPPFMKRREFHVQPASHGASPFTAKFSQGNRPFSALIP